jgi:membrane-associated protease RseP (regulator of RpoE activity)
MNGYLIALIVFLAWVALVYVLHKRKWFAKHNMSLMGPAVMWRTNKGKALVERLASYERFWSFYGKASLWICAGAMATIMILLLWEATLVSKITKAPSPELILGIPGINPIIPVGYGILALVVGIAVHEIAHGIITRNGGMRVLSLGLLFLVFPIGAFVEPDEKQIQATTRSKRAKVFAAGPATNLIVAMVILFIFSSLMMSSLEPVHDGALATGVVNESPLEVAGVRPNSLIVSIGGTSITSQADLDNRVAPDPGETVSVEYYYKGDLHTATGIADGIVVAYAAEGFAAHETGVRTGMVLVSLNDTPVSNLDVLTSIMAQARAGDTVNVIVMSLNGTSNTFEVNDSITTITLSDKWDYYDRYDPDSNSDAYHGVAYLGGGFLPLGVDGSEVTVYSNALAHPFRGDKSVGDFSMSWLRLIALPFLDLAPVQSPITDLYSPGGSLAWMPDTVFWLIANSLYWIFWINLMVGLTNVLPMIPLDGGYIFKDGFDYLLTKFAKRSPKEKIDAWAGNFVTIMSLFVFGLILWQLVGPAFNGL